MIALVRDPKRLEALVTELDDAWGRAKETADAANELIKDIELREAALAERQAAFETTKTAATKELDQRKASLDARAAVLDEVWGKLAEAKVALKAERQEVARIKAEAAEQLQRLQVAVGD